MICHCYKSRPCWQRRFTKVPNPLIEEGNYLLLDAIEKQESGTIVVSIDNAIPWYLKIPGGALHHSMLSVQHFSSWLSSLFVQDKILPSTSTARPITCLDRKLSIFSFLLQLALRENRFDLLTNSVITRFRQLISGLSFFGLPAVMEQLQLVYRTCYPYSACFASHSQDKYYHNPQVWRALFFNIELCTWSHNRRHITGRRRTGCDRW